MRNFSLGMVGLGLAILILNFAAAWPTPQERIQKDNVEFMRLKMTHMQSVIQGLALEDFQAIAKHAQSLKLLAYESNWSVFQSPEYVAMSKEFRDSADRLAKAAKANNLDGSTLAYFEVTLNCVRCHKYVRLKRQIDAAEDSDDK